MSLQKSQNNLCPFPIELRPSRRYVFLRLVPWWLLVTALLSMSFLMNNYWFIFSLPVMLIVTFRYLHFTFIRYSISLETMTVRRRIISRQFDYLEWFRVKDYKVTQNMVMRLLGLMTVKLYTTDLSNDVVVLEAVPKSDLPELIRDLVMQARLKNRIFEIN